jgi:hypothetical protein
MKGDITMKAVYTKEFWQSRWDKMMERVPGDFYMNLEEDLNREVKPIEEALKENNISVTDENHKTLLRLKAKGIADKAEKKCKEQMEKACVQNAVLHALIQKSIWE